MKTHQGQGLLNRRQFIASAAIIAGGAAGSISAAEGSPKIKMGFLGAAHSHALEKWRTIGGLPDYEPIGVCEESAAVRELLGKAGARFLSREELFERCDAIAVESAVRDHARDAKLALAAGKHVHVEKPPAVTRREFESLVQLARDRKRLLQTGYMWRFHPGLQRALDAARQGWLGEIFLVRAQINTQIDPKRRPEWAGFKGGSMFELGCHLIDPVVRLLGKPARVTPHLQRRGGDDLADNCVAFLEFGKAAAIVTSSVLQPNAFAHRFFEILGTNGTAIAKPLEPPALEIDLAKPAGPYQAGVQKIDLPPYRRYRDEFVELAAAIREGRPLSVAPDTELLVHETLLQACGMS